MENPSGLPGDVSGSGLDMTAVNGSPTYSEVGPFSNPSIGYPSTAYHERAVVSTKTNDMSIVLWVRRDGATTTSGDIWTHGSTSGGFQLEYSNTTGTLRGNLPGVGTLGTGMGVLADQTWTMIALGKSSGAAGIWFGGQNGVFSNNIGTASPGTPVGNDRLVGSAATSTRIAHAAFFDRMLTQNEVSTMYQIGSRVVIPL